MAVNFIRKLEGIFEKHIEGFFNKKFSRGLQPVEIAKQLVKEMEARQSISVAHIYVPNHYSVALGREDYERMIPYGRAIQDEVCSYLVKEAVEKGYTILGAPVIEVAADETLTRGMFRVSGTFTQVPPEQDQPENSAEATRIFARISPVVKNWSDGLSAVLTIIEGTDIGMTVPMAAQRINIGRREGNELPLTDMNTSRLHAYIDFEENAHVVYDAKSLNGTHVDGQRITRLELQSGNRIKVGNTVILYEVK